MDDLTSCGPFSTFQSDFGKLAGQLSLETTILTRILSVFNLLKRVGFAILLWGGTAHGQLWRQVELAQSTYGISEAEMVSDSFGNMHIYYEDAVALDGGHYHTQLKFMYLSSTGTILFGPVTLDPGVTHPTAHFVNVAGDGMTRSWCVWSDSLADRHDIKGMLVTGFNGLTQSLMDPVLLGPDEHQVTSQYTFDLVYRPQDETLHFVDARFRAYHSEITTDGDVLVWQQPIDTVFITSRVLMSVSPSGEVWAALRNEVPGYVEALFVRFDSNGGMTVRHPFGTGQEHWSTVSHMSFDAAGNVHLFASYDDEGGRYCLMDSEFTVVEWHDIGDAAYLSSLTLGVNAAGQAMVVWAEDWNHNEDIYTSLRDPDMGWIQDSALIALHLRPLNYLEVESIGNGNWAVLACIETNNPPRNPSYLNLFTTDTVLTSLSREPLIPKDALTIFPNPSNGLFAVQSKSAVRGNLRVFNILGRLLVEYSFMPNSVPHSLDLSVLPSGKYFIKSSDLTIKPVTLIIER